MQRPERLTGVGFIPAGLVTFFCLGEEAPHRWQAIAVTNDGTGLVPLSCWAAAFSAPANHLVAEA